MRTLLTYLTLCFSLAWSVAYARTREEDCVLKLGSDIQSLSSRPQIEGFIERHIDFMYIVKEAYRRNASASQPGWDSLPKSRQKLYKEAAIVEIASDIIPSLQGQNIGSINRLTTSNGKAGGRTTKRVSGLVGRTETIVVLWPNECRIVDAKYSEFSVIGNIQDRFAGIRFD